MLQNSWSNKLASQVKCATITNIPLPTVIYQSTSNQLMAHNKNQSSTLPIRKQILSLSNLPTGQILLLTRYQLSCFDLLANNQIFNLEFQGAQWIHVQKSFILVVAGSDVFCYNFQGEEQFVNHCQSNITSLAVFQNKGQLQVVISLSDLTLARYKGVNMVFDYGKTGLTVSSICSLAQGILLGSQEGTVAFYQGKKSKWKAKSSHAVLKVLQYKGQSGVLAIISRVDGLIQIKDWKNKGQTLHKIKLGQQLKDVIISDFRQDQIIQLICVTSLGNLKGINVYEQNKKVQKQKLPDEFKIQQQNLQILREQKLTLQFQINQLKQIVNNKPNIQPKEVVLEGILAKDFVFQTYLHHEDSGLVLNANVSNGYISGLAFQQPICPISYDRKTEISYTFAAQTQVFGQITCYLLVHSQYVSKIYEACGFKITLPKFWKFNYVPDHKGESPICSVKMAINQRNARYIKWVNQTFFMKWTQQDKAKLQTAPRLHLKFYNPYSKQSLHIISQQSHGLEFKCNDLKVLGDLVQDLVDYQGLKQLDSELIFPNQIDKLKQILETIQRLSLTKISLSSQMAEGFQQIKFKLVKGESARCVEDMNNFRKCHTQIMTLNRGLMLEVEKKNQNTKQLSQSLKLLGLFINQTSNVRYGKAKQKVVASCRQAIKRKQFPRILTIMQKGAAAV